MWLATFYFAIATINSSPTHADIAGKLVEKLGTAAAGKAGGFAATWVLHSIGVDTSNKERLTDIQSSLGEQKKMLGAIQADITRLDKGIKNAVTDLKDDNERIEYNTAVRIMNSDAATIMELQEELHALASLKPSAVNRVAAERLRKKILNDVRKADASIHNSLIGVAGAEGVLSLFARLSFKHSETLDGYATKLHEQFMYYYTVQASALQLVLEAFYSGTNANPELAREYYRSWSKKMNRQIAEYRKNAPRTKLVKTLKNAPQFYFVDFAATKDHVYTAAVNNENGKPNYQAVDLQAFRTKDWKLLGKHSVPIIPDIFHMTPARDSLIASGNDVFRVRRRTDPRFILIYKYGFQDNQWNRLEHSKYKVQRRPSYMSYLTDVQANTNNLYLFNFDINALEVLSLNSQTLASQPSQTIKLGESAANASSVATQLEGDLAYVLRSRKEEGRLSLNIINLKTRQTMSTLTLPKSWPKSRLEPDGPRLPVSETTSRHSLHVANGFAIISGGQYHYKNGDFGGGYKDGLWIADVHNPRDPKWIDMPKLPDKFMNSRSDSRQIRSIATSGNLTYIASDYTFHCLYHSRYQDAVAMTCDELFPTTSDDKKLPGMGDVLLPNALRIAGEYLYAVDRRNVKPVGSDSFVRNGKRETHAIPNYVIRDGHKVVEGRVENLGSRVFVMGLKHGIPVTPTLPN